MPPVPGKKVRSAKCVYLGVDKCELCHEPGTLANPLTAHHADGNRFNNDDSNFLVCHRWLCHTWADWLTQWFMSHKLQANPDDIKWAYKLVTTSNWLLTLTRNRRK